MKPIIWIAIAESLVIIAAYSCLTKPQLTHILLLLHILSIAFIFLIDNIRGRKKNEWTPLSIAKAKAQEFNPFSNLIESNILQIIDRFRDRIQESKVAKRFETLYTNGSITEASRILTDNINKNTLDLSNIIPCVEAAILLRRHINNDLFYDI